MMIVYTFTLSESGAFPSWAILANKMTAIGIVNAHCDHRIKHGGAIVHREISFTPEPVAPGTMIRSGGDDNRPIMKAAPECITCVVYEKELRFPNGHRAIYAVIQQPVIE